MLHAGSDTAIRDAFIRKDIARWAGAKREHLLDEFVRCDWGRGLLKA